MTFRIRKTADEEITQLGVIERSADSAFTTIPGLEWVATAGVQSDTLHHRLLAEGYSAVAVDEHDIPVGFINGDYVDDTLHILGVAVTREYQGQGMGKLLMADAIRCARERALHAVTLTTFRTVPWNQPFYERLGFDVIAQADLPAHLIRVLDDEAAHGFCRAARCAMRLKLRK
ncbi:putative acetyltransferase [Cronobacter condimenti 1330]|uniref:Acetyltransferase n=1 Tax=Cronobacter condimenti 1330 TaxID=1073999 RepID=K8AEU0_9ENTR|nr:GNAT family N-acetyltransferase [Cronobacter condimenti]ALB64893.1 acetyltransferase [Cronobacter condimenti 1330]CCJ74324.1 putative acetyltransferase [Cronobacter condimenti 1330]